MHFLRERAARPRIWSGTGPAPPALFPTLLTPLTHSFKPFPHAYWVEMGPPGLEPSVAEPRRRWRERHAGSISARCVPRLWFVRGVIAETREIFEQVKDEHGRTRLDRPFTPEEAKERDARNRERLQKGRTGRLEPFFHEREEARAGEAEQVVDG